MKIFADKHIFDLSKNMYESVGYKIDDDSECEGIFPIIAIRNDYQSFDLIATTTSKTVATELSRAITEAWENGIYAFDIMHWAVNSIGVSYQEVLQLYF